MTMTSSVIAVALIGAFCCGMVCGFEWETLPDPVVFSCTGKLVTFPWRYKMDDEEDLVDIHWIFDGAFSSEMVATSAHERFLPARLYSQRVRHVLNSGLSLHDVTVGDSGNYTVEVNVDKQGAFFSHRHSVYLQVGDSLMTEDGRLKVEQDAMAVRDDQTQQWVIRLTCGVFTFLGQPPLHVSWTTPTGETKSSTGYDNGRFFLTLPSPVLGGNYTCLIPGHLLADACVTDSLQGDDTVAASVSVDELMARLSVIEAEQRTLKEDNRELTEENSRLKEQFRRLEETHARDVSNLTDYITDSKVDLDTIQQSLQDYIQRFWNVTQLQQALLDGPCAEGEHKVLDDATRNVSHGPGSRCDSKLVPGWYRFKLGGADAVMPTSCVPVKHCGTSAPMWLDLQGAELPAVGGQVDARTCAHWNGQCCNWQQTATVFNCGAFFVYKLQPSSDCNLAFCAESKSK